MELFDYQKEFNSNIRNALKKEKRIVCCLATGGGKTVVMSDIVMNAIAKGSVPLICCHRVEIFHQIYATLKKFGIQPGVIVKGHDPMSGSPCYLGMVETVCRRIKKDILSRLNIKFLILDECHYGSYHKLIMEAGDRIVLGFTASPKSTGKPELNEDYSDIVESIPVSELIRIGRLVPARTISIKHDFSKVKMKGGDYDDKELIKEFSKPKLREGAVQTYLKETPGQRFICYNINVQHSLEVFNQFIDSGVKVAHVDANTPDSDREAIWRMYRAGEVTGVLNVGIATTGFDDPETQVIIQNFATASIVKHTQTVGRGARTCEGKKQFTIIDPGNNWARFGRFGTNVDWKNIFDNPSLGISKETPKQKTSRQCDECGSVIKFTLQMCPFCDSIISKSELEKKLLEGATMEEIKEHRLNSLPVELRKHPKDLTYDQKVKFAKVMGYSPRWAGMMTKVFSQKKT